MTRTPAGLRPAKNLRELLGQQKKVIFTMIQKFTDDEAKNGVYSTSDKLIVVTDEAHRTQYGMLALNMAQRAAKCQLHRVHGNASV